MDFQVVSSKNLVQNNCNLFVLKFIIIYFSKLFELTNPFIIFINVVVLESQTLPVEKEIRIIETRF